MTSDLLLTFWCAGGASLGGALMPGADLGSCHGSELALADAGGGSLAGGAGAERFAGGLPIADVSMGCLP